MEIVTYHVPAIDCDGCVVTIKRAVSIIPGVTQVGGDPNDKTITIAYDPNTVEENRLMQALERAGYPPQGPACC